MRRLEEKRINNVPAVLSNAMKDASRCRADLEGTCTWAENGRREIPDHVLAAAREAEPDCEILRVPGERGGGRLRKQKRLPKQPFNGWRLGGSNP